MRMKKFLGLLLLIALVVVAIWALQQRLHNAAQTDQLQVVATFYPLGYLAEQVGGDYAAVTTIIPATVEPHDYAPTPKDIVKVTSADVLIYNGGGLDTWAEQIPLQDYQKDELFQIKASAWGKSEDPHVWLDPTIVKSIVNDLRNAYSELDPSHLADYQHNAEVLLAKLEQLDQAYQTGLASCEIRQAIVAHDAYNYLAERYNIELLPIIGLNPNETPSAQTIAELSTLADDHQIDYIFFEELTSPKLSQVLADEVGAQTLVLSPLEGLSPEEQSMGADYFSLMNDNLANLRLALRCE